jgi:tetratricopeptide (TPR) repeat protein
MNQNRIELEKIYFRIIEWGTYLILLTPFIFVKDYFFPYVVPKTIFFRVIVDIIFIAYILLVISNPRYRPKFTPLTIGIIVFLGVLILTSITGVNFERSFWSTFERMTGLLTFFHLFVFYIVLTSVFKERKYWERILSVSILVGVIICLYVWMSTEATARGGGTLGNTSFLSAYLLFDIFFAIILLFTIKNWWKIFYGASLIFFLYTMFFNQEPTRGAIGALWGGLFVLGFSYLVYFLFSLGKKSFKILAVSLVLLIILGSIGFLQLSFVKEKIGEIWQSGSMQSRLVVWKMGWESWQGRFWLGWGPENFNIPFAKYFNPELPLTHDIWYDRVHNIILDTGVASGILGLITYLAIFAVAIWGLARTAAKVAEKRNIIFPLGMISLLLVYLAQNIWVFDMVSSYMVFFLTLAFINYLAFPAKTEEEVPERRPSYPLIGALLIILAVFSLYLGNIQPARASRYTVRGLSYPLEYAIPAFEKALDASPMSKFEVPEQISTRVVNLASQQNQNTELLARGLGLAELELKNTISQNPLDFRLYLFLGKFYTSLYQLTRQEENIEKSLEWLEKAKELSPKNQQVYWSLAQVKLFQGEKEKGIEFLQKAIDLEPRVPQSHWYLASAYRIIGKYQSALEEVKKAEELGYDWKRRAADLQEVIEIYKNTGVDNQTLISLYEIGVERAPENANFWGNLADLYAAQGEKEKAKQAAEKMLESRPDLSEQVQEFLKSLGY